MFFDDDPMMHPPAVVKLKQQYDEPDWSPPPGMMHRGGHVETRDYWGGNARGGGNSLLADERDSRIPTNNYQYPTTQMGRALSPRQQHQYQSQQLSNREMASYKAAIKAVNDSMNTDGRGNVTALRGLWKVFDAAMSELGTELNDSLSNKAIFEGKLGATCFDANLKMHINLIPNPNPQLFRTYYHYPSKCHARDFTFARA